MARKFFDHEQFNFGNFNARWAVCYGARDVGVCCTADRVVDGSWQLVSGVDRDRAPGDGCRGCASSGHQVSARAAYLRAAAYRHVSGRSAARRTGALRRSRRASPTRLLHAARRAPLQHRPRTSRLRPVLRARNAVGPDEVQTGTASQWPDPFWSNACSIGWTKPLQPRPAEDDHQAVPINRAWLHLGVHRERQPELFDVLGDLLRVFAIDCMGRVRYTVTCPARSARSPTVAAARESCMRDFPARIARTGSVRLLSCCSAICCGLGSLRA